MSHKLIHTKGYLLVVDDSEIKEGDYLYSFSNNKVVVANKLTDLYVHSKKIIAHLPLNNSPILEGVDLLPPFSRHQEDGIDELAHSEYRVSLQPIGRTLAGRKYDVDINYESRIGFINGHNKAKEKYKYTEEDMINAYRTGVQSRYSRTGEAVLEHTFIQSLRDKIQGGDQ